MGVQDWLDKIKKVMGTDKALEVVESMAEFAWFKILKPMGSAYVLQTTNKFDDAAFGKVCEFIESMLNDISKTDGD